MTIDGIKPVEATIGSKRLGLEELVADELDDGDTIVLGADPVPVEVEDDSVGTTELVEDSVDWEVLEIIVGALPVGAPEMPAVLELWIGVSVEVGIETGIVTDDPDPVGTPVIPTTEPEFETEVSEAIDATELELDFVVEDSAALVSLDFADVLVDDSGMDALEELGALVALEAVDTPVEAPINPNPRDKSIPPLELLGSATDFVVADESPTRT